jgi:uncharacterized protein (TIGR00255 family)
MPLHSMTAFAREACNAPCVFTVELRSVNQRYLDCHFKLPETLRSLEPRMREALTKRFKRGKIECHLRVVGDATAQVPVLDRARLAQVAALLREVDEQVPGLATPDAISLLQFPGVCSGGEPDEDALGKAAMEAFTRALDTLATSRAREGAQLAGFLEQRLETVAGVVDAVRAELPFLRRRQEERLRSRITELAMEVDEGRMEQELAYLAQKADVDEELDRLAAHVAEARRILEQGGPCGRRLDFLMQEFNREANTLSSKSSGSSTTQSAVELKVLIEQMREQVQNIE